MHWLPAQQGLPGLPQVAQTPPEYVLLQIMPLPRHMLVEVVPETDVVLQQVSPGLLPHRAHTPDTHFVPAAVHTVPVEVLVPLVQQGLPGPPQAPVLQDPAVQVPARGRHEPPSATHRPETQQPLLWQVFPAQQICPGAPQAVPTTVEPPDPPLPVPPDPDPPLPLPPAEGVELPPAPAVAMVPPATVPLLAAPPAPPLTVPPAPGVVPPAPGVVPPAALAPPLPAPPAVSPPIVLPPDALSLDPPLLFPPVPVSEVSPPVPPVGGALPVPLQP